MIHLGKVKPGSTIEFAFGSFAGTTGAPSATTGNAAGDVQIYKDGGTTQRASSAGVTFTVDFDSLTGVNYISIDLADNTTADFYAAGSRYTVVISDVTIDSQTVRFPIGSFVIGHPEAILDTTIATLSSQTSFTLTAGSADDSAYLGCLAYVHDAASAVQCAIGIVSAYTGSTKTVTLATDPAIFTMAAKDNISLLPPRLLPTVRGRTLDVSSGGEAGIDWANVGSPTTTVNLSGTTVKTATDVETDTQDIQSRLPAALVSGRIDASVGAMASGVLTATAIAADAITAAKIADGAIDAATFAAGAINAAAIAADAITDAKVASDVTIASVTGSVGSVVGAVGSVTGLTASDVGAIKTKTDFLPSATAGAAGGVFIAGSNAATSITTALTANIIGNVTGNLSGSVGSVTGLTASNLDATISSRASAANLATAAGYIDTEVQDIKAVTDKLSTMIELASGSPGDYRYSADALVRAPTGSGGGGSGATVSDIWSEAVPGAYSAGSAGYLLGTYLNATVSSRATQASVDTVDDFLDTEIAAIKAKTDNLPAAPAAVGDIPTAVQNADALLNRDMSTGTDSGSPSVRTVRQALRALRNKWTNAGGTYTVYKEDDTTSSWTSTIATTAGADPITGSDPA